MQKTLNIIEKEYRFLISLESAKILPPDQIGHFKLANKKVSNHTDYLFEREVVPLKDDNVGFRVRKAGSSMEFTYKKFLGKENGVVNYDEFTTVVDPDTLKQFKEGDFNHKNLPVLTTLSEKGSLYFLLEIINRRTIYTYTHDSSTIELMVEDIKYKNNAQSVSDSMMEIEINISNDDQKDMDLFVEIIKEKYDCVLMDEGKNTRAARLLGIDQ